MTCDYVGLGMGAVPTSITYLARLRPLVPQAVSFKKGLFRNGSWSGDPAIAKALGGAPGLGAAAWHLVQPKVVYGNAIYTIEAGAVVAPDPDGAILVVVSTPDMGRLNVGGARPAVKALLDVAERIEAALVAAPGVESAAASNVPLPEG